MRTSQWVGGLAIVAALLVSPIAAIPGPAAGAAGQSLIRVAHLSPDTPGVDVWVDGKRALGNVGFRTFSDYLTVPSGSHALALRPAGAAATSTPALAATATLAPGRAYTVAGEGPRSKLAVAVYVDDLSAPPSGEAKVRIINAALGVTSADITSADGALASGALRFGQASAYRSVSPRSTRLELRQAGSKTVVATTPAVDVSPGHVYSIAAVGGASSPLRLLVVVDASSAAVAPTGGIQTGYGGTAPRPGGANHWLLPSALGVAGVLTLVLARRRRRDRRPVPEPTVV